MQRAQLFLRDYLISLLVMMLLGIGIKSLEGAVTHADVTGNFQTRVSLAPFSCNESLCEEGLFTVNLESRLQLAIALGGIALGIEGALGTAGPEFLIWNFQLDAGITLQDRLIFAVPFGRAKIATGERIAVVIPPGSTLFVRQETLGQYELSGVTLRSVLIFEDVTFPSPLASPLKNYSSKDQNLRFGVAVTLEGETYSATRIESTTYFCLDPAKRKNIIHRSFAGKVCDEGLFSFTLETLRIRDLPLLPSIWSHHTLECRPTGKLPPLECVLESDFDLHRLPFHLVISTSLDLGQLLSGGGFEQLELQSQSGLLTLELTWNELLALKRVSAILAVELGRDERSALWRLSGTLVPDSGLTRLKSTLTLQQDGFTLKADITYSKLDGALEFTEGTFTVVTAIEPVHLDLSVQLATDGFQEAAVEVSVPF